MTKFLFVCSANKHRSKTADDYFSSKYPELHFSSGGTNHKICKKEGTELLTDEMIEWADCILVMEEKHRRVINSNARKNHLTKTKVLHIPDIYQYYQKELIAVLEEKADSVIRQGR
ncbi:MAG: phosphotyrosine protein phosphatase [Bacteroidota bacterium]